MNPTLTFGSHKTSEEGVCLLEACALIAGEAHTDHPVCVCPVLSAFLRKVNDLAFHDDEARTQVLLPLVESLISSRASEEVERARAYLLIDSVLREMLPLSLAHYGFNEESALFSTLPALTPENLTTVKAQYEAAFRKIDINERPDHLSGLLVIILRATLGGMKALSQMTGPLWAYQAEEAALCAAHAYSWISDESDESESQPSQHIGGLAKTTYDLIVDLVRRAVLIR